MPNVLAGPLCLLIKGPKSALYSFTVSADIEVLEILFICWLSTDHSHGYWLMPCGFLFTVLYLLWQKQTEKKDIAGPDLLRLSGRGVYPLLCPGRHSNSGIPIRTLQLKQRFVSSALKSGARCLLTLPDLLLRSIPSPLRWAFNARSPNWGQDM